MRKDARARRDRLIAAAADAFRDEGYGVALEQIAQRAGVGRGTLYRNFSDRDAMIVAVLERRLDELRAVVSQLADEPRLFEEFIKHYGGVAAFHAKASIGIGSGSLDQAVSRLRSEADDVMQHMLSHAIACNALPSGVTTEDVQLAARMIAGVAAYLDGDRDEMLDRAMRIIASGLRSLG
ncbi:TetR/AcrR family transcriptional regulator [Sphingomonas adhaesiva]|uniref:TetR/AcrR family transcriptional regulator n=1 Tax=Sphingomonas adhaesiva TaxID=28212 RepID=UPI0008334228|nr:TetR/AcrR family transcriptional regulator [Sphingomonas adhaesiva]